MSDYDDDAVGGVLGGEGASTHDRVTNKVAHEGVVFTVQCAGCGKVMDMMAPWPEIAVMAAGAAPPNNSWLYNQHQGCFVPNLACRCRSNVRVGITPDECTRHLRSGIAAGKISPQQIQAVQQQYGRR